MGEGALQRSGVGLPLCSSRACLHTAFIAFSVHSVFNVQFTPALFRCLCSLGGGGRREGRAGMARQWRGAESPALAALHSPLLHSALRATRLVVAVVLVVLIIVGLLVLAILLVNVLVKGPHVLPHVLCVIVIHR